MEGVTDSVRDNVEARLSMTSTKGPFTEADVRRMNERADEEIRKALEPFGYYRPAIRSRLTRGDAGWNAVYTIDPGPALKVDSLDIQITGDGADDPAFRAYVDRYPLKRGAVLIHDTYRRARTELAELGAKNGYLDAHFVQHDVLIDMDRYTATILIDYETGPQYHFGDVQFKQSVVDPSLLNGYVTFKRGQPVDTGELLAMESSLSNSPYFSRVQVHPRTDLAQGKEMPVVVDLVPAKRIKFTAGAGYGTDNGIHAQSQLEFRRLNRRGHRALLEGTYSSIERSGAARYVIPWPYPRTDLLTLSTGYAWVKTLTSTSRTSQVGAMWSRGWHDWQQTVALNYRRENFEVGLDHGLSNLLIPEATWSWLRSNDPVSPSDARRLRFRVSAADEAVVSKSSFLRGEGLAQWLRTFSPKVRLTGRLEAGALMTNEFHQLPPSIRFFAGGSQSVRGYGYNTLGSRDAAGNVIGGQVLAIASVEYEYPINPQWSVAAFYDIGNAMQKFSDPLESGAGPGIRWSSPIGRVRFDLGFPVSTSKRNPQFHLSIGPGL
jgi:translocation and assembly module TamA